MSQHDVVALIAAGFFLFILALVLLIVAVLEPKNHQHMTEERHHKLGIPEWKVAQPGVGHIAYQGDPPAVDVTFTKEGALLPGEPPKPEDRARHQAVLDALCDPVFPNTTELVIKKCDSTKVTAESNSPTSPTNSATPS